MPIFGIDLGAKASVVATVGKREVSIVRNDLAERLTPSLVSYTDKERLIGDAALTCLKSNISNTPRYFKNLLGLTKDSTWELFKQHEEQFTLSKIVPTDTANLFGYDVGRETPVTATEVLACYLKKLRSIGEAYIGAPCADVVVAVPSWFTDCNRAAVLDACTLAGLTCYRVMSHAAATALNYGLFRSATFTANNPHVVCFVDIGAASATVTIASFLPNKLEIKAVEERPELGGRSLDRALLLYLAEQFKKKTGCDVFRNRKALLKLEEAAEKAKIVLSANKDVPVHVECLMEDEDLEVLVSRQQLEELATGYNKLLVESLQRTLEKSGYRANDLASVEVLGGGIRVPSVLATIETVFSTTRVGEPATARAVSRTVSGDESVARGAAIQGAMLHPCHRVKDFQVVDVRTAPVYLTFPSGLPGRIHESVDERTEAPLVFQDECNTVCLFDAGTPSYFCKWFIFPAEVASLPGLSFNLAVGTETGTLSLGSAEILIPEAVRQAAANAAPNQARLKVCFFSNIHGIVDVSAAFAEDYMDKETYVVTKDVVNEAGETVPTQVEETRDRQKTRKTEIPVKMNRPHGWLTRRELKTLAEREQVWAVQDEEAQASRNLANEILATCFRIRSELDSTHAEFASPQEKEMLIQKTREWEEWIETNQGLSTKEYTPVLTEMKQHYDPVEQRKSARDEEIRLAEEARRLEREAAAAAAAEAAQQQADAAKQGTETPEEASQSSPNVVIDEPMEERSTSETNQ